MGLYVLTTKRFGSSEYEFNTNSVHIYRTGYNSLLDKFNYKTSQQSQRNETGVKSYSGRPNNLRLIAEKIVSRSWRKSYWPDGSKLFLEPGITKGDDIISNNDITHIVSVGLPYTCHLIAKKLKEKHNHVKWHMDIQDPFCYSKEFWVNNFNKYAKKNIDEERTAFEAANSISITNDNAKAKYLELFPFAEAKIKVIPPLFAEFDTENIDKIFLYNGKKHIGYLKFLSKLQKDKPEVLEKLQFHLFGQQNKFSYPIFDKYPEIKKSYVVHGFKDRNSSMQYGLLIKFWQYH